MKKLTTYVLLIIILLSSFSTSMASSNAQPKEQAKPITKIKTEKNTFTINNSKKTVNVVTIDLNNPDIKIKAETANDSVVGAEDFQAMVNRKKPLAAINANYFDAYSTLETYGKIIKNGKISYLGGNKTVLWVTGNNKVDINQVDFTVKGYMDGIKEDKWNHQKGKMDYNSFVAWRVNNISQTTGDVTLYTPERGTTVNLNGGMLIEIKDNIITNITRLIYSAPTTPPTQPKLTTVNIPNNGYLLHYGETLIPNYDFDRFWIGRTIALEYHSSLDKEVEQQWIRPINSASSLISAGPYLVKESKIVLDPVAEGFTEAKITTNRAQRSAIGITKDNKLIMLTGSNLTLKELAEIMVSLGCDKAMNLDGGASSGLYAEGKIITNPGRKLKTVLMIYDK